MIRVIKHKCLIHIILWSSTLLPWRVPCVHKNWSSEPLVAVWLQRPTKNNSHTKNIFKDTSTIVGTHNWHVQVKHVKTYGIIVNLSIVSLFLSALKASVSPFSTKSISHENLNIKDVSYKPKVFPLELSIS